MEINSDKISILYLDDEPNNLFSFKAAFRIDFDVKTAVTATDAFEILKNNSIHVVITDYRMPVMNGVEFLEKVRQEFPKPVRMLLTAFTDIETVIDAVNRGFIFRYIQKPWNEIELKFAIEEGYKFYLSQIELQLKHAELIEAYRDLDRFVYSVSHDLRSPLTGIYSLADLISNSSDLVEINEYNEYIKLNIKNLEEFVKNLLEYYRVKRGALTIARINFKELINTIVEFYSAHAITSQIEFITEINQEGNFNSDSIVLSIILQNLVSNSIKYQNPQQPKKFIKIKADISNFLAIISVEDNGVGIEEEFIPKVFDMFFRASSISSGSGIGLYNTKNAVDKLNGKISIHSVVNSGTLVKLEIPSK